MKKIIFAFVLTGCVGEGTEVIPHKSKDNFLIVSLFEVDGCTIYRFNDGGRSHYFTSCKGETATTQKSGKTSYKENIPTK